MGSVTNVILSFSIQEDEDDRIKEVNEFFNNGKESKLVSADFQRNLTYQGDRKIWYGGSKFLTTPLFVGAYNYLDTAGLIKHLKSVNWKSPEDVQLFLKRDESNKFEIIDFS